MFFVSLLLNNCFCINSSVNCASLAVCHGNDGGDDCGVMMIMKMKLAITVDDSGDDENNTGCNENCDDSDNHFDGVITVVVMMMFIT